MIKSHRIRSPALVFGLVVPLAAFGQSPAEDYVLIGAGLRARPAYDGSDSQRGELVPVLRYYGRPWFARTTQGVLEGGARIELAPGLNLGAQLAYEGGRAASESGFLRSHDVPDIDPGISLGLHAEWDRKLGPVPITLLARVRRHAHADLGAQADLRRSEEHTSELQSPCNLVCRLLLEKKKRETAPITGQNLTTERVYDADE